MKRLLILFGLFLCTAAYAATYTTNYNLYKPGQGDTGWADLVNTNFDTIDTQMKANYDKVGTDITTHAGVSDAHHTKTVDTDTTYTADGTLLDLTSEVFSINEGTLTDTKYCTYEAGTGIQCNSEGGSGGSGDLLANGTIPLTADWDAGNSLYDITAVEFKGALVGNASTSTALAANGSNCSAGNYPLGVDASGNVEDCTAAGGGGGGDVTKVGTPVNNEIGVWTGDGTIEGDTNLTWDGSTFNMNGDLVIDNGTGVEFGIDTMGSGDSFIMTFGGLYDRMTKTYGSQTELWNYNGIMFKALTGTELLDLSSTVLTLNPSGANIDTIVETDTNAAAFVIDAGAETATFGIATIIENAGTGNGLFIDQDGNGTSLNIDSEATTANTVTISSVGTGDAMRVLNAGTGHGVLITQFYYPSQQDHHALYVVGDQALTSTNSALVLFTETNASTTEPVLEIANSGSGAAIETDSKIIVGGTGDSTFTTDVVIEDDIYTTAWTDYTSTSTIVGWSGTVGGNIKYKKVGNLVFVQWNLTGTSNSTTTTFTLPYNIVDTLTTQQGYAVDNGSTINVPSKVVVAASGNTVSLRTDQGTGAWTASGAKNSSGQFWYEAQ